MAQDIEILDAEPEKSGALDYHSPSVRPGLRMIRSMTAFASGERNTADGGVLGCELRAVNHRFLELGLRLPEELRAYDRQHEAPPLTKPPRW